MVSCVGTVEDAVRQSTLTNEYNKGGVIFSGVQSVKAISHNKIEVFFYPATGKDGDKFNYVIHYGNDECLQYSSWL